jgi:hypothetical protein
MLSNAEVLTIRPGQPIRLAACGLLACSLSGLLLGLWFDFGLALWALSGLGIVLEILILVHLSFRMLRLTEDTLVLSSPVLTKRVSLVGVKRATCTEEGLRLTLYGSTPVVVHELGLEDFDLMVEALEDRLAEIHADGDAVQRARASVVHRYPKNLRMLALVAVAGGVYALVEGVTDLPGIGEDAGSAAGLSVPLILCGAALVQFGRKALRVCAQTVQLTDDGLHFGRGMPLGYDRMTDTARRVNAWGIAYIDIPGAPPIYAHLQGYAGFVAALEQRVPLPWSDAEDVSLPYTLETQTKPRGVKLLVGISVCLASAYHLAYVWQPATPVGQALTGFFTLGCLAGAVYELWEFLQVPRRVVFDAAHLRVETALTTREYPRLDLSALTLSHIDISPVPIRELRLHFGKKRYAIRQLDTPIPLEPLHAELAEQYALEH